MRWLIRRYQRKSRGTARYSDDVHYGDVLTVGRGTDQSVQLQDLEVALEHLRITALGGHRYRIEALTLAGVRVDGALVSSALAKAGVVIELGRYRLELLASPPDYDAAVAVIPAEDLAPAQRARRAPLGLAETGLSMRRWSWLMFLTLFALGGLPAAAHWFAPLDRFLRDRGWLPDRSLWDTGPLAAPHRFFGEQCELCHEQPFRMVRDRTCLRCHGATPAHADPARFALPAFGETRCAHCHREHNGAKGLIVSRQALCRDCHVGLASRTKGASSLADYGDFATLHPQFQIDLPRLDPATGRIASERVAWREGLEEQSGLRFPHDKHLAREGLRAPAGTRVLHCADCHRPEPGGARMQPIDFESHCQDCHRLSFDPSAPDLQVPHARVPEILFMLESFYAKQALEGEVRDADAPPTLRIRRRPGQPIAREEREEALLWARDKARRIGESLFTGRACAVCHQVSAPANDGDAWQIAPVRVAGAWYRKARFDHGRHTSFACADCHDAARSQRSSDLLIPGIENCRGCHAGEEPTRQRVQSACIACHDYHLPGQPPMRL
jgi:mono/diheme cytochrome c family protein